MLTLRSIHSHFRSSKPFSWFYCYGLVLHILLNLSTTEYVAAFSFVVSRPRVGIDYGPRRIGLAVSTGSQASPLRTIHHGENMTLVMRSIAEVASNYGASELVVGVPLGPQGAFTGRLPGFNARLCVSFARQLFSFTKKFLPQVMVTMCDERYTTREAKAMLLSGAVKGVSSDALSAACLLEGYVAERGANSVPAGAHGVFGLSRPDAESRDDETRFEYGYVARHVRKLYRRKS